MDLRNQLLAKVNSFTPNETVFEVGTWGKGVTTQLMRDQCKSMGKKITGTKEAAKSWEEKHHAQQTLYSSERQSLANIGALSTAKVAPVATTKGEIEVN